MKIKSIVLPLLVVVLMVVGTYVWVRYFPGEYKFNGSSFEPYPHAYAFSLVDGDGNTVGLEDLSGKVVVLFFGYTYCPDVCPTTLADFKRMIAELGDQTQDVAFVFITADPARDTPERMQEYTRAFDERILGLSGTEEQLKPVWDGYFVRPLLGAVDETGGYLVEHPSRLYVVDKAGRLRLTFPGGMGVRGMLADIRFLIGE